MRVASLGADGAIGANGSFLSANLAVKVAPMGGGALTDKLRNRRFWRPLTGVVVAYAVAAQSLLIVLGGFALPAQAHDAVPAFSLCLHGSQGASELPAGTPGHSGCTHCIFCFAGSHHAVIGAAPAVFRRVDIKIAVAASVATEWPRPIAPAYSIASPRGPPLDA
jgi:hypothetical protein